MRRGPSSETFASINVLAVTSRIAQRREIRLSLVTALMAILADHVHQCVIDILGHAFGITAEIDVSTGFEPAEQFRALFENPMLHVELLLLIAAERGVEAGENATLEEVGEFVLIEEIVRGALFTEEKPGGAARRWRRARARTRGTARSRCRDRP